MEKDHFLDRHPLVNEHGTIFSGDEVFICLKNMQPYAKELQDLTKITVSNYLTSQGYHPRGQKVKGMETIWDEKNKKYTQEERVGRITYKIINGNIVPTTEGYKYIEKYGNNKLKLSTFKEIKNKFVLILVLRFDNFTLKVILDKWLYFDNIESIQNFINKQNIENPKLFMDRITLINNERPFEFKDIDIYYKNKFLNQPVTELFEYLLRNYEASNTSSFNFNKYFDLELDSFEVEKPKEYNKKL